MAKTESVESIGRSIALMQFIAHHGSVSREELCRAFNLNRTQLKRSLLDIAYLGELADRTIHNFELDDFGDEISLRDLGAFERPMHFTPQEGAVLMVSMEALVDRLPQHRELIQETMRKVRESSNLQVAPVGAGVMAVPNTTGLEAILRTAILDATRVSITYQNQDFRPQTAVSNDLSPGGREISPQEIVTSNGAVYVRAWCFHAAGVRLFKLTRIISVTPLAVAAGLSEEQLVALAAESAHSVQYRPSATSTKVKLSLRPEAGWLLDHFSAAEVRIIDDSRAELEFEIDKVDRVIEIVLSQPRSIVVLSPKFLRDSIVEAARHEVDSMRQG